jgi:carboxypeptidase Taq
VPPDDRDGCLQDIHWYDGLWGYFATYTLGALIAAQFAASARQALPTLADEIARGEFRPLLNWLGTNVHSKGSLLTTAEMIAEATGRPLGTAAFEAHLRARYLG